MGNKVPKNMEALGCELKKADCSYKYRKVLVHAKPLVEKFVKLPRPGPPGPTTLDNKDPYDDYDELKKTMTRESFVLNGKLLDDFVGDTDRKQVFKLWYQQVREALKKMNAHDSLIEILTIVSPKIGGRRLSCLPSGDMSSKISTSALDENYSSHVLIMWVMQASSRARAGKLAYRSLQQAIGVVDGDVRTMIFDTMKHPCATKIHIKESILRVEIHSVLTIQRDENGVDFEFDVGCTIVQTLNLDTFVYSRKVLFDFFEYADDMDKLTKKRQKKLQTPIECSMVPISFKENKHELETLARVYRPEMGTPDGEDGDGDVSTKT